MRALAERGCQQDYRSHGDNPGTGLRAAQALLFGQAWPHAVEETDQGVRYRIGQTEFLLFPSSGRASGDHTQLGFEVNDLESAVTTLRQRGVSFEEYDMPGFKSVGGILELEGDKGAWFKDSEGNLISLVQRST